MSIIDRVQFSLSESNGELPIIATPVRGGTVDLAQWISANRKTLMTTLDQHGAVLFRNFEITNTESFEQVVTSISENQIDYVYRSTPRTLVSGKIYTATEYPAKRQIPMHNENSYQKDWPMLLLFYCAKPAESGGETPLANTLRVTNRLKSGMKERFATKGIMYVRNYRRGLDLPWQTVFQTEKRECVESYCSKNKIEFEWRPNDGLTTKQTSHAIVTHPRLGHILWFNQAHLFHFSSLDPKTRAAILSVFAESDLPRNSFYGDGAQIESDVLHDIRQAYEAEKVEFQWRKNDVLLLDNMLVCHGRNAYTGSRSVFAAMAEPYSSVRRS